MKRRLAPRLDNARGGGDVAATTADKRGCQIHPLGGDPVLQTLTPRSLAKSVAELDALRSRVLALELQLSQNEVDAALLVAQHKSVGKKLPPIGATPATADGSSTTLSNESTRSADLTANASSASLVTRTATVPVHPSRRAFALTLPSPGLPLKASNVQPSAPLVAEQRMHQSQSVDTLASPAAAVRSKDDTPGAQHPELGSTSQSTSKRLAISRSFTGLSTTSTSPLREETKITLGHDGGDVVFAVSQRNRLYQILKRVSTIAPIKEDELVVLKKLVDAEIGDVINCLVDLEHENAPSVINAKLAHLLTTGSPSKHPTAHVELPRQHPVWGIQYPLQKIARNLEQLRSRSGITGTLSASSSPSKRLEVIVLVSSGAYNPIHMLHIRAFYVARQYVESNYTFPVVGAFISPSHDTYVRVKNRRNPREMITKRHRLALIEAAVATSTWIEVDKWEITRRRVLDYLSTLTHVREMCESHFPAFKFHVMYVCGCNTVVKLSHSALRDEGFGCITICRPTQTEMVVKHLGKHLARATTIVEDTGVLPCDLERATSFRVRKALASGGVNAAAVIELMVGKSVFQYFCKHDIGSKIAGKEPWSDDDKQWRDVDLPYVEYVES